MGDLKDLLKTIKAPKGESSSKSHVIINPEIKDDDESKSNKNSSLAAKSLEKKSVKNEHTLPPKVRTMTGKKTAIRHVNRRYVPAHSVQRSLQGRALPTAGIQASSTRNEGMDITEISKILANRYVQKATVDHGFQNTVRKNTQNPVERQVATQKMNNRKKGISRAYNTLDKNESEVEEMKTSDSEGFPQGPVDDKPQNPAAFGRSLASKSMATLKQDLSHALAKDDPAKEVTPDGPVKDQLLGAPYNKGKDLSVDDLDNINKEIGVKLDA